MARPSTQQQRRRDILNAAKSLLERHDLAALRLGDVADELGMTPNAIRYYYKDIDHLLSELCAHSNERFYTGRLRVAESLEDAAERLAVTIAAGLPSGAEDVEWRVIWRAVLAAGFEFDKRPEVQEIYHRQVGLYEAIFEYGAATGRFRLAGPARDLAQSIMALEDYLGYRIVARDHEFDRPTALRLVRGYAELATEAVLPPTP
ncbi:TetR/AcrR family transcriptional regulator [Streptomyces nodosus]|uniref:TetR/AcrR family transcriptional regulator n=1 Tax=Streptomyces nodosus TaxID=40318 RepID=UPI0038080C6B